MESQDIDALLISALYGELTPADEARLAVHLQAHPNDRIALDDLTRARNAIRDSRALELQVEPPQAVSALLLQEAARSATKPVAVRDEEPGWFLRFMRSIAAHPAMAAAAMLVIVLGAGALVSSRKGKAPFEEVQDIAPRAPAVQSQPAPTGAVAQGSGSPDTLDLPAAAGDPGRAKLANESNDSDEPVRQRKAGPVSTPLATPPIETAKQQAPMRKGKAVMARDEEGRIDEDQASDLAGKNDRAAPAKLKKERPADDGAAGADGYISGGGAPAPSAAVPPPPPAPPPREPSPEPATRGALSDESKRNTKDSRAEYKASDPATAWAQNQHKNLVAQVRAGDCRAATSSAMAILDRAPAYYQQNVATDRALKGCLTYINEERSRRAKRATDSSSKK
ncbi:MAG: anti-sigma factor [Kofleriaceae bacterium]